MRLIDADALIEKIRKLPNAGIRWFVSAEAVFDTILKAPTIELHHPKGHWIFVHPLQKNDNGAYICSECKVGNWEIDPKSYFFCPNCGVKMEEGEQE